MTHDRPVISHDDRERIGQEFCCSVGKIEVNHQIRQIAE